MEIIKPKPPNLSGSLSEPSTINSPNTEEPPQIVINKAVRALSSRESKERQRMVMTLTAGWQWNPLLKTPRNKPCPCGKPVKFKECCLPKLPRAVPTTEAIAVEMVKEIKKAREGY